MDAIGDANTRPIMALHRPSHSESASYPWTSKSFVAAGEPFKKTSSLYFPVGHPSGFEMWNSVLASPVGAIACSTLERLNVGFRTSLGRRNSTRMRVR